MPDLIAELCTFTSHFVNICVDASNKGRRDNVKQNEKNQQNTESIRGLLFANIVNCLLIKNPKIRKIGGK